ncbi:hypothetical protein [Treponema endosymbiont of Eucomonympha sp.]|uniref:hypothetical protein n=1 Tax=Treponema endosymbiont of Eucomonympha sp. TaxID=1580831 RepID=UPI000AB1E4A1|nr:hypothetical protein [Treponema endosymbiont of Eucomonympha sp.]
MNSNDEGNRELCVARGDSLPAFEGAEDDFNEILRSSLRSISFIPPIFTSFPHSVHTT